MYPYIIVVINILVPGDIIISIDIRHVIVLRLIVANRAPLWLTAYIYARADTYLRTGNFE
jgi:hypothetical protein